MRAILSVLALAAVPLATLPALAQDEGDGPRSRPARPELPALGAPAGTYGEGVELEEATPLAKVAEDPERFAGETIRLDGRVDEVCLKKGCWLVLQDGEESVRVRFLDYGFFVPRDCADRAVIVQGTAEQKTISEELARHYAKDAGDAEAAEAIDGPQEVIAFTATGVEVLGSSELPPRAEGDDGVTAGLSERLGGARSLTSGGDAAVESAEEALELLRELPASRTRELELRTELDGWFVFGLPGEEPFAHGFAVAESGAVVRF